MTNGWTDIRNADVILAMGGNPAENHPVGFRFVMEARRNRNAKLVCVDPRFNRTAAVADRFVQIRVGTDIAFLGGLIHHALSQNRYHEDYVKAFTNATFLVKDTYAFDVQQGVFSGWDAERKAYTDTSSWAYELDERGMARTDPTMQHPRSVFQVMKAFYSRYTPEAVANICGCTAADFLSAADLLTSTGSADKAGTIMYALGWTHHSHAVQLIHAAAMLQLLLGNIGRPGGGLNALRGHANIQGGTDCGVAYHNLPGTSRSLRPITPTSRASSRPSRPSHSGRARRTSGRTPIGSWSANSRRITATMPRATTASATRSIHDCRTPRRAAMRTGAGRTSSTTCTPVAWKGSSVSA